MKEEFREIMERAFQAYGAPLEDVTSFKDLGRVMTVGDDYWPKVVGNLQKVRKIWAYYDGRDRKSVVHHSKQGLL